MAIKHESVLFGPEKHSGLLCYPEGAHQPLPAVIVIQEIWGVDHHIEDVTHRFAAAGYAAFAPDLFAKGGERPAALTRDRVTEFQAFMAAVGPKAFMDPRAQEEELAKRSEAERTRIQETKGALFAGMSSGPNWLEAFVPQLKASSEWLRSECPVSKGQKVAAVGFCMGGGLAALLACEDQELAAAVIYYGSSPASEKVPAIRAAVMGHYASLDERINAGVPAFTEAMQKNGKSFTSYMYEGAAHGFFRDGSPSYHVRATRDSLVRTLEFLREHLL